MKPITDIIPEATKLLELAPEELAFHLLQIMKGAEKFMLQTLSLTTSLREPTNNSYRGRQREVDSALSEACNWLQLQGLIVPDIASPGGAFIVTRRGQRIADQQSFRQIREEAAFPKALLHPTIADDVWQQLARGNLSVAVFIAFRAVEEAVRAAAGYSTADYGVDMMHRAFKAKGGPLTDASQEIGERSALGILFAGAIGSYKNPHSHRTVTITDVREAQEIVMIASHLLRIVDSRREQHTLRRTESKR